MKKIKHGIFMHFYAFMHFYGFYLIIFQNVTVFINEIGLPCIDNPNYLPIKEFRYIPYFCYDQTN